MNLDNQKITKDNISPKGLFDSYFVRAKHFNGLIDFLKTKFGSSNVLSFEGSPIKTDLINELTTSNGVTIDGLKIKDGEIIPASLGTAATGVTATHKGDGKTYVTTLSFTALATATVTAAANEAHGVLLFTFPAGDQIIEFTQMDIALTGSAGIVADTPDVGIGSVIATGAVAVLGGTGGFEDYITGQASGAISGSNSIEVALLPTGQQVKNVGTTKTVHLNVADGWAAAGTVTTTGTVTIKWTKIN